MTRTLVAILLFVPCTIFCQAPSVQTGSIRGQVTDARTGDPLIGANVVIVASRPGHGAASDMNGMFRMNKIPPGEYVVKVTYIEYETALLQHVKVEAGQTTEANVKMRKEGDTEPTDVNAARDSVAVGDSAAIATDSVKHAAKGNGTELVMVRQPQMNTDEDLGFTDQHRCVMNTEVDRLRFELQGTQTYL